MSNFHSLSDLRKKEEEDKGKKTDSYAGGDKSGLAIEHPDDQWGRMQQNAAAGSGGPLPEDHVNVTVYRNGFVVGDGPFRPNSDPLNKRFLDEVSMGRCPEELQRGRTEPVHVAMHDKRSEDYKEPPPPAYTKFSGEGNTMGAASASSTAPVQADKGSIQVDASKPTTKIQIRFHTGEKKAQEFNEEQTVGDLRLFCSQCVGNAPVTLNAGFPPKPVTDDSLTLKAAGLLRELVTVKLAT